MTNKRVRITTFCICVLLLFAIVATSIFAVNTRVNKTLNISAQANSGYDTSAQDIATGNAAINATKAGDENMIFWADGITPPKYTEQDGDDNPNTNGDFVLLDPNTIHMGIPYFSNNGWYDINKDTGDNMCFAVAGGNLMQWWIDRNREYIERFLEIVGENTKQADLVDISQFTQKKMLNMPTTQKMHDSPVYMQIYQQYITSSNIYGGGHTDLTLDFFINGYQNTDLKKNSENSFEEAINGGFFNKVFGKTLLTNRIDPGGGIPYAMFSDGIKQNLLAGNGVAISHQSLGGAHAVTVWGAEYNKEGKLQALYISDSDDRSSPIQTNNKYKGQLQAMRRFPVFENAAGIAVTSTTIGATNGSIIYGYYTLSQGTDIWEEWLAKNEHSDLNTDLNNVSLTTNTDSLTGAGGKLYASKTKAKPGETITLTVAPDTGFVLKNIESSDVEIKEKTTAKGSIVTAKEYSFVMPSSGNVTINANFAQKYDRPGAFHKDVYTMIYRQEKGKISPIVDVVIKGVVGEHKLQENMFKAPYGMRFDGWEFKGSSHIFKVGDVIAVSASEPAEAYPHWVHCDHIIDGKPEEKVHLDRLEPTSTTDGYIEHYVGKECGTTYLKDEYGHFYKVDPNFVVLHKLSNTVITHEAKEPTCTTEGNILYYEIDGLYYSDIECLHPIDFDSTIRRKKPHNTDYISKVAPTCTHDGKKAHWHCDMCGQDFEDQYGNNIITDVTIPKHTAHYVSQVNPQDNGKLIDGHIAYWQCECGKLYRDQALTQAITKEETILKAEHTMHHVAGESPTHSATGIRAHYHCAVCGKNFEDKTGNKEIEIVIPVLPPKVIYHSANSATCTQDGNIEYYERDGKYYSDSQLKNEISIEDTITKGEHNLVFVKEVLATCTTAGVKAHYHCDMCGQNFKDKDATQIIDEVTIPKHTVTYVPSVEPNANTAGNIEYWQCECGKIYDSADLTREITLDFTILPATGKDSATPSNQSEESKPFNSMWLILIIPACMALLGGGFYGILALINRKKI